MNERDMALGRDWAGEDLTGWFLSEKLNGCRAAWDGYQLWTRGGNLIPAPAAFIASLPASQRLDGEIYTGPGQLEASRLAVQFGHWTPSIRFVAFDAPNAPGNCFERLQVAAAAHADAVKCVVCQANQHAVELMAKIQLSGGEGIVARQPSVGYEPGRTSNFLKVKKAL